MAKIDQKMMINVHIFHKWFRKNWIVIFKMIIARSHGGVGRKKWYWLVGLLIFSLRIIFFPAQKWNGNEQWSFWRSTQDQNQRKLMKIDENRWSPWILDIFRKKHEKLSFARIISRSHRGVERKSGIGSQGSWNSFSGYKLFRSTIRWQRDMILANPGKLIFHRLA